VGQVNLGLSLARSGLKIVIMDLPCFFSCIDDVTCSIHGSHAIILKRSCFKPDGAIKADPKVSFTD